MSKPEAKRVRKWLFSYIKREKGSFVLSFVCACVSSVADIAAPFLMARAIDKMIGPGNVDFKAIGIIIIAMLLLMLLVSAGAYLSGVLIHRCVQLTVRDMRKDAYEKLLYLPLSIYDRHSHGDIISRFVNDATAVADGIIDCFIQLFTGVVTVTGSLIFMLIISPFTTAVVVAVTLLTFPVAMVITRMSGKSFADQQSITGELTGLTSEMIGGLETVKAFAYEDRAEERFEEINDKLYSAGQKAQFVSTLTNPTTRFVNYLAYISVGVIGGIFGGLTAGMISGFIVYSNLFSKPFNQLTAQITGLMAAYASAVRLYELVMTEGEPADSPDALTPGGFKGEIEFRNVYFSYLPDRPLIENFSLKIVPGQKVAIVGPTGAGKSTLVNLIMRFYEPQSGEILIDGIPINKMTREALRSKIAMVLQETWLFGGSIRDNIAYGHPGATDEQVTAAAKAAYAHGFIRRLPGGYDTVIDPDGDSLSAGQKQLLTIARAILSDSDILILDEATSSIDTMTEQRITKAFDAMTKGKTSFIIAHRLSTIKDADVIIVMRDGHIVEKGSHEQLMDKGGFYAELYGSRFKAADM